MISVYQCEQGAHAAERVRKMMVAALCYLGGLGFSLVYAELPTRIPGHLFLGTTSLRATWPYGSSESLAGGDLRNDIWR